LPEEELLNKFKLGNKVDIKDPLTNEWVDGVVKILERDAPDNLLITAGIDG